MGEDLVCFPLLIHSYTQVCVCVGENTVRERSSHVELVLERLLSQFLLCSIGIRLSPKPVEDPTMQKLVLAGFFLGRRCEKTKRLVTVPRVPGETVVEEPT